MVRESLLKIRFKFHRTSDSKLQYSGNIKTADELFAKLTESWDSLINNHLGKQKFNPHTEDIWKWLKRVCHFEEDVYTQFKWTFYKFMNWQPVKYTRV